MKKIFLPCMITILSFLFLFGFCACTGKGERYVTENGITYYSQAPAADGAFSLEKEIKLTFEEKQFDKFNRMTFVYSSEQPLYVCVKYVEGVINRKDGFYLPAGERQTFSGVLSRYLKGKQAKELKFLTVRSLTEKTDFRLHSVSTELIPVYSKDTYYLENQRYKLGVRLGWGGGINYIEDKSCNIEGLKNLINDHDTGRLVQQSYYGTAGNNEYKPGKYNGTTWTYNPVQGGDKYGNASRLVDVVVTSSSVYVKTQPQDWSLNNKLTPSYMENTYELREDCIKVSNVFTDFSGWEHHFTDQELPAFYTVSYLDDFVRYDGDKPWTDDELTSRNDLKFWGDPAYAESCRFALQKNNTETWCAWVSSEGNYGVGLYVPNVDVFYAGRFCYNGSKSSSDVATNYVAPLNRIKIASYEPIEYGYLITAGSVNEIRNTFKAEKDFSDNASLRKNYQSMRIE